MKTILDISKPGLGNGFQDTRIFPEDSESLEYGFQYGFILDRFFLILRFPTKRELSFILVDVACLFLVLKY